MKILYITTVGGTLSFFRYYINELIQQGHTVDLACSETERVRDCYREWGCQIYPLSCSRSPFRKGNLAAIRQIKALVAQKQYDIVHCHTPIAAVCTRLACIGARKKGTRVFYSAHGFHFYKGAPMKNWLMYYPAEWLCSFWTDTLITTNQEDFVRAGKLHAGKVALVPGVGVDVACFSQIKVDRGHKRRELGVPEDAVVLLSVGELNKNKNHQIIIRAMAQVENRGLHYLLAGRGDQKEALAALAEELGVKDRVHLLGFREDVGELCAASDIFCFPSLREGLGMAALEAMSCGLPLVTSNVRGISDYSEDGVTGYCSAPCDVEGFARAIRKVLTADREAISQTNRQRVKKYDICNVNKQLNALYFEQQ